MPSVTLPAAGVSAGGGQVYFPAAAWILVLAVQGAVSLFLVRRGAPVNLYIVWNVAAVTLLTVLVFWGTGQTLSGVPDVPEAGIWRW